MLASAIAVRTKIKTLARMPKNAPVWVWVSLYIGGVTCGLRTGVGVNGSDLNAALAPAVTTHYVLCSC